MKLSPREKDKLLISMAAMIARNRKERGVKLNYPEAIALISDFVDEGIILFSPQTLIISGACPPPAPSV